MLNPTAVSRRDMLRLSALGVIGTASNSWLSQIAKAAPKLDRKYKSCILLFMNGGPSQAHTFDLKEGREFKAIKTNVPGIEISEHLPLLAKQMNHCALLRGMSTGEAEHIRARYLMHTGYKPLGSVAYPGLGCVVSAELGQPEPELPNFVTINGGIDGNNANGYFRAVPAHLGPQHSPLHVENPFKGVENLKPVDTLEDLDERVDLLKKVNSRFASKGDGPVVASHGSAYKRAVSLLHSVRAKVFDLEHEPAKVREAYGKSQFGQGCLLARRLVEAGLPFVEVMLGGWDDHGGSAEPVKKRSGYMDPAMSTLISDLSERGLLDSTLVVWMGEFGRSPHDNGIAHYARAWTTLLAGGGLKLGQVVGKTDATGKTVEDKPVSAGDFMATILTALNIDPKKTYETPDGRPISLVDAKGKAVEDVLNKKEPTK